MLRAGDKPPNELRIALAKGRDLSVKDKPVLWGEGTSDPRVSFSLQVLGNDKAETPLKPWHSRSKKKTLNPTWNETYTHPLPVPEEGEPGWVLTATCEDVDGMSSADFMGKIDIELESILKEPKRRSRQWHHLEPVDGKSSNVTGELDIVVQWRYNPALDFDPWRVRSVTSLCTPSTRPMHTQARRGEGPEARRQGPERVTNSPRPGKKLSGQGQGCSIWRRLERS